VSLRTDVDDDSTTTTYEDAEENRQQSMFYFYNILYINIILPILYIKYTVFFQTIVRNTKKILTRHLIELLMLFMKEINRHQLLCLILRKTTKWTQLCP